MLRGAPGDDLTRLVDLIPEFREAAEQCLPHLEMFDGTPSIPAERAHRATDHATTVDGGNHAAFQTLGQLSGRGFPGRHMSRYCCQPSSAWWMFGRSCGCAHSNSRAKMVASVSLCSQAMCMRSESKKYPSVSQSSRASRFVSACCITPTMPPRSNWK